MAHANQLTLPTPILTPSRAPQWPRWLGRSAASTGLAVALPLAILGLWQLTAAHEWVSPQVLPAPAIVWATFVDLIRSGDTPTNLAISLGRVAWGFGLGALIGLALGIAMAVSPTARAYLHPTFLAMTQVPALGWIPLLMMFVGIGEALKIIIIVKAALVPVALNAYQGIRNIPETYFEVAAVFRYSRIQTIRRVVLPAALPGLFNGLRLGLTHAWLALVTVELLASSEGIGFQMVWGRQLFQLDVVLATIVVIGAVGLFFDQIFQVAERWLLRWRRSAY
jgi:sulfonate transport system permease protein